MNGQRRGTVCFRLSGLAWSRMWSVVVEVHGVGCLKYVAFRLKILVPKFLKLLGLRHRVSDAEGSWVGGEFCT